MNTKEVVGKARSIGKCIPAFNVPHIPMVKPIAQAIADENSIAFDSDCKGGVGENECSKPGACGGGI